MVDEARSVDFYQKAFGFRVADRYDFDSFTLVYLRGDGTDFELELTINKGTTEPYDLGKGYGHLAVTVEDLEAEHARFKEAGLPPRDIKAFHRDGALMATFFFFVQDPDGYQIEVLQRQGRFQ